MSVWRYTAVDRRSRARHAGELAGETAPEVRASLRRIGLQVIDLRLLGAAGREKHSKRAWMRRALDRWRAPVCRHLRCRRRADRAELYDAVATMLDSGLQLMEAFQTCLAARRRGWWWRGMAMRSMLVAMLDRLGNGASLAEAMGDLPAWFDPVEIAMVRAGQRGGHLASVLQTLAERQERAGALRQKVVSALAYPAIVAMIGLGVVVFLSVKTLPDLARVLENAGIDTPALTMQVMSFGQLVSSSGWFMVPMAIIAAPASLWCWRLSAAMLARRGIEPPRWWRSPMPGVLRRMALGSASLRIAGLIRCGIPLIEALRVVAPTAPGAGVSGMTEPDGARRSWGLCESLLLAAERLERGEEIAEAMDDGAWFDPEFRRILVVGQTSGEVDVLLERLGHRYERHARRTIDRLAALIEPAVILALAVLVGIVVMAAVLPLVRVQEMF